MKAGKGKCAVECVPALRFLGLAAAAIASLLQGCAPLAPKPAEPAVIEPSPAEPPVMISPVPRDPMAEVKGDRPLPLAKGALEQIDCLNGEERLHARMALEARGGQVTSFAYYSRWQSYTCSIHLDQRDPKVRWRRTEEGAVRVQTPQGSFVIHADPESYVFEFQNVQRAKFCGMYGSINGTMTILRNASPPRCSSAGILDR